MITVPTAPTADAPWFLEREFRGLGDFQGYFVTIQHADQKYPEALGYGPTPELARRMAQIVAAALNETGG